MIGNKEIFAKNLKSYMDRKGIDRNTLCSDLNFKYTTVRDWLKGITYPRIDKIEILANYFKIEKSDLIEDKSNKPTLTPPSQKPADNLSAQIMELIEDLSPKGKKSVLNYASDLLEREQDEAALAEPELFKIYYTSAAKAGPKGFGYDDYESDYVYTNQEPPRYDIATMVDGYSMAPDYQDGDILYLRDYGASTYNGDECVVVVDDKSYFKKVYSTDTGLLLVSLNDDKTLYPDFEIDFPPTDGSHIKIFNVVGSFTPIGV